MARGLSELQRTILRVALRNRHRAPTRYWGDVTRAEIFAAHYGWQTIDGNQGRLVGNAITFAVADIGRYRYQSAHVAVTRAVQRLIGRALIKRSGPSRGLRLTQQGVTKAESIG